MHMYRTPHKKLRDSDIKWGTYDMLSKGKMPWGFTGEKGDS